MTAEVTRTCRHFCEVAVPELGGCGPGQKVLLTNASGVPGSSQVKVSYYMFNQKVRLRGPYTGDFGSANLAEIMDTFVLQPGIIIGS